MTDRKVFKRGPVEVRFDEDGGVDEIVIYGPDGKCLFHAEDMGDHFWARADHGDGSASVFNFTTAEDGKRVRLRHEED
jgi:hypothetical protein